MMRRSVCRLAAVATKPATNVRPGSFELGASDWIQQVNPLYHIWNMVRLEEEVDARKARKWLVAIVLLFPLFKFMWIGVWELIRLPSKVSGEYPAVAWNDGKAGAK
eukprot:TRINITY_DN8032_c0_g1_i1.p3 TRINITY_DN8032_c0_g1~~TRINITY_DN8032_c0_g1_i1.p3  ORF type:complete len:106 (+),score=37.70 TRINITY_DN8032_c0_g1_i1:101-418(+)